MSTKRKHDSPTSLAVGQQQQFTDLMGQEQLESAGNKKQRTSPGAASTTPAARGPSLNFSIESIMNNTSTNHHHHQDQQFAATTNSSGAHKSRRHHGADKSIRSAMKKHRSSPGAETKQRFGSRSPSPAAPAADNDDDEVCSQRTSLSGSSNLTCAHSSRVSSSRSSSASSRSSRASTPISPGCNSVTNNHRHPHSAGANALLDQHNNNHYHEQQQHQHNHHQSQVPSHHHPHHHQQQQQHQHHHHQSRSKQKHYSASSPPGSASATSSGSAAAAAANQANPDSNARLNQVECVLDNKDMWDKFHSLNTEMIITKTGRRMFPVMKVQFHNLDPNARYAVSMDIVPVDNKRYRYAYHKSCWQVAGKADPSAEPRLYAHPDSPFNGDLLSRQVISFEKVKLTNNEADKTGHIILNSMHKYQPRVHLIELKQTPAPANSTTALPIGKASDYNATQYQQQYGSNNHRQYGSGNNKQQQQQAAAAPQLDIEGYRTFVFPETVFTAVTAYQNQLITKMKIDKNPFAKGFRDSSRLSDLDRGDPFDYMSGPLGSLGGPGGPPGSARGFPGLPGCTTPGGSTAPPGSLDAATAAMAAAAAAAAAAGLPGSNPMDAYQLLANNPWYSAAAVAAAAGQAAAVNPFGSMGAACSTAQAAQQLQTQMWLATLSACLGGGQGAPGGNGSGHGTPTAGPPPMAGPDSQHHDMKHQQTTG